MSRELNLLKMCTNWKMTGVMTDVGELNALFGQASDFAVGNQNSATKSRDLDLFLGD